MTRDDRLAAFLGEVPPSSVSALFEADVMQAIERRALLNRLMGGAVTALVVGVVLWACSPVLNMAVDALAPTLFPVAGMLVLAIGAAMLGDRLLPQK